MEEKNFNILKHFMIDVDIDNNPPSDFYLQIAAQRDMVLDLMDKGVVLSYGLSDDSTKLWLVAVGKDKDEIRVLTERFPLFKYMTFNIVPLMFFSNSTHKLPELSLN